jgi:hypothetical protein
MAHRAGSSHVALLATLPLGAVLALYLLTVTLAAHTAQLSERELHSYLKTLLSEYYAGKLVYAKVAIPDTERGLQIVDGKLEETANVSQAVAAQPGDALLIKQLKFKSKSIEVELDGERAGAEATPDPSGGQRALTKSAKPRYAPRIHLRFARDLTTRDLNIQSINRLLALAVDVKMLIPKEAEPPAATQPALPPERPNAALLAEQAANAQGIPTASVTGELAEAEADIGELTIECSVGAARVYIDGAYSGATPRTIKLLAGVYSILLVREGYALWEQKFFIPGGKASRVRTELKRATP